MRVWLIVMSVVVAALAAPVARAQAGLGESGALAIEGNNSIDARQFRIDNARVPGASARQSVMAWQVMSGSWGGQTLDGLSLVMVKTISDEATGDAARQVTCYVSHVATPAQRNALIGAFLSTQPGLLSPRDVARMRVEPGVIVIDMEDGAVVLHLGLVS
ncbi:MAG TPA: DUF1326 domain-containing protein [Phycisphaerae bacterium]|nr:DUF1326 domain-containing protein [Phycisphaerae bacterium]